MNSDINQSNPRQKDAHKSSLWRKQLHILGYKKDLAVEDEAAAERTRIDSLSLDSIEWPEIDAEQENGSFFRWLWPAAGFCALACALSLVVMTQIPSENNYSSEVSDLTPKGTDQVVIYFQRDSEPQKWDGTRLLEAGDAIRAELIAGSDLHAYLVIVDRNDKILGDSELILDSKLTLVAGERATFAGSVRLVGPTEGESLVVFKCPVSSATKFESEGLQDPIDSFARLSKICPYDRKQLR